jgi:hypothetical protein
MNKNDFELQMMRLGLYKYPGTNSYVTRDEYERRLMAQNQADMPRGQIYNQLQAQKPQVIDMIMQFLQDLQISNMVNKDKVQPHAEIKPSYPMGSWNTGYPVTQGSDGNTITGMSIKDAEALKRKAEFNRIMGNIGWDGYR